MDCKPTCPLCHGTNEYEAFIRDTFAIIQTTLPCPNNEQHKKFVILEGIKEGNRFFSTNDPEQDNRFLADGTLAYRIMGYADTVEEAQLKLYGYTFPLGDKERIVDYSKKII